MGDVLYYENNRNVANGTQLPVVSKDVDSVRAYQFEVEFTGAKGGGDIQNMTLAAKQVGPTGFSVADIEVNRVNDKVFYPGKPTPESLTITFDNILKDDVDTDLWNWFKGTYDPTTGFLGDISDHKINVLKVHQLEHDLSLRSSTEYYGVYPSAYKLAEWNYATNDFHTIEVTFRYDFMAQVTK
tara:strand:- start:714 stop:1265 length:552 start_codon:yes stop_codon:yes gene_type:complete